MGSNGYVMTLQRKFRNEFGDVVVQRQLAALHLLHHGDSGERQHGADDVVHSLVSCWYFKAEVGETVSFMQQDAVAARHQHGSANNMLPRDHPLHDGVEIGG